jgi:protein Tex
MVTILRDPRRKPCLIPYSGNGGNLQKGGRGMMNIAQQCARELSLKLAQVDNAIQLLKEGCTVPFIARYRKERTGEMDEVQLHALFDRFEYLTELEQRKVTVLDAIQRQGKLSEELRAKVEACLKKTELEDLYLPYRPKKKTRASVAKERGLEPLALFIKSLNTPGVPAQSLEVEAAKFVSSEKGVSTQAEALAGASDILAEEVAERAEHRAHLRQYFIEKGFFVSEIRKEHPAGSTKYEMYRSFKARVRDIHPHNMLALLRGEKEGVLTFDLAFDQAEVDAYLQEAEIHTEAEPVRLFYVTVLHDAFDRLIRPSLASEVRTIRKEAADHESIKTFEENIRDLLLSPPAGLKPALGIDPGLRTGVKVAALDGTGKFLGHQTIYPQQSDAERQVAAEALTKMLTDSAIDMIAIGNGTGSREAQQFVAEVVKTLDHQPVCVIVNEAGASVYSASRTAREEFPDLDVTIRGAISIGRRLQDPLAELVKIDPKSIGVGQYQHDVDQKLLRKKLQETVESCVNYVGVDVNTASKELLRYVAGVNMAIAKNIVAHRDEHGPFQSREALKQVPKLGPKSFEQAAGFLRIRQGAHPLDASAVHPESYHIAEQIIKDLGVGYEDLVREPERLKGIDPQKYVTETVGEPTLRDIIMELQKPGRDPRAEFKYATFKEGIREIKDLAAGLELEGVVTNVTNFGAFVDIGVHQDGLVHVSQMANRYIDDPKKVVHVGQIVKVRVLEVNEQLKRISLTMKAPDAEKGRRDRHRKKKKHQPAPDHHRYTVEDLKQKFNNR